MNSFDAFRPDVKLQPSHMLELSGDRSRSPVPIPPKVDPSNASASSRTSFRPRLLHLFSGPSGRADGLAVYLAGLGWDCEEWDNLNGALFDLTDNENWERLLSRVRAGMYDAGLIRPPSSTFSNAKNSGDALRTATGAGRYGRRGLEAGDKELVRIGTLLAVRAARVFEELHSQRKPLILEQPPWKQDGASVSMFNLDEYVKLRNLEGVSLHDMFQHEYGAGSTLMAYQVDLTDISAVCSHAPHRWEYLSSKLTSATRPSAPGHDCLVKCGRWGNVLVRSDALKTTGPHSASASYRFSAPLRGLKDDDHENHLLGGMRHPRRALGLQPKLEQAGGLIRAALLDVLKEDPELVERCVGAVGSLDEQVGPTPEDIRRARQAIASCLPRHRDALQTAGSTKLRAELLLQWGLAANDPDASIIHNWLTSGSPAGIEVPIEDPGVFPPNDEVGPDTDYFEPPDADLHTNYSSVDGDPAAEPEVQRLFRTGFVKSLTPSKNVNAGLGESSASASLP